MELLNEDESTIDECDPNYDSDVQTVSRCFLYCDCIGGFISMSQANFGSLMVHLLCADKL